MKIVQKSANLQYFSDKLLIRLVAVLDRQTIVSCTWWYCDDYEHRRTTRYRYCAGWMLPVSFLGGGTSLKQHQLGQWLMELLLSSIIYNWYNCRGLPVKSLIFHSYYSLLLLQLLHAFTSFKRNRTWEKLNEMKKVTWNDWRKLRVDLDFRVHAKSQPN
jgi:hypothetical protein